MDYDERPPGPSRRLTDPISLSVGQVAGATALEPVRDPFGSVASHETATAAPALPKTLPPSVKKLLSLDDAKKALDRAARQFKAHAVAFIEGEGMVAPKTFVIRATVGLGKTHAVNEILPEIRDAMAAGKAIAIAEPTNKKGFELRDQLISAKVAEAREIIVLLGREAENPEADMDPETGRRQPMCRRVPAVRAVAGYVDDVSRKMCRSTWTDERGEEHVTECPFFASCAHVRQGERARYAKIIIVSHAALQTGQSELSDERDRLVTLIVDEDATRALVKHAELPLENIWSVPADPKAHWPCREPNPEASFPGQEPTEDRKAHAVALKTRYRANIVALKALVDAGRADTSRAELRPSLVVAALAKAHGWEVGNKGELADRAHKELSFMAVAERNKTELQGINPATPDETVIETVAMARIHDRFRLATLWTRLRDQVDAWAKSDDDRRDYCRSVLVDWKATAMTEKGDYVAAPAFKLHYSNDFKGGVGRVPTLILDADADPVLLGRWGEIEPENWIEINAEYSKVIIRQAIDRSGSMASMKKEATIGQIIATANYLGARHRGHIKAGMSGKVNTANGDWIDTSPRAVAVFSIKATVATIRESHMIDSQADAHTAALDANVDPAYISLGHYGELRGINAWQHCSAAVIAGRIELSLDALEDHARAVWHDQPITLDYAATPETGPRRLPMVPAWYRTKDGLVETSRTGHTDARIDAVLQAIREAELRQALGRVRPVQRPNGDKLPVCEVVVLTSIPLGLDVIVDSLHDWTDLAANNIDRVWTAGIIPDHTGDLAALADMTANAFSTAAHRRRVKRDISSPTPGRRFAADLARSAYADVLGRPGDMDIGERKAVRFSYYFELEDGTIETRRATVLVARGETRRDAFERAIEIIARLGANAIIEGDGDDTEGFAADFELGFAGAWWAELPAVPATPGLWGGAIPKIRH